MGLPQSESDCAKGELFYGPEGGGSGVCVQVITGMPPLPAILRGGSILNWAKSLFSRNGASAADDVLNANKLNHIFRPEHNLGNLVNQLGSQQAVFSGVQAAAQTAVRSGGITGVFETTVSVAGQNVVVRGNVIDGVVRIGTFFIP